MSGSDYHNLASWKIKYDHSKARIWILSKPANDTFCVLILIFCSSSWHPLIYVLLKVIFDNHVQLEIHKIYGYPRLYWHQDANGSSFPLFAFSSLISEADIRKETLVALLFTRFIGTIVSPIVAQKFFEIKLSHKDNFIKHCILLLPYTGPVKSAKYLSTY